jgi:hypothetical protein
MKGRRIRWAGKVAHLGGREMHLGFWVGNLKGRDHLRVPGVNLSRCAQIFEKFRSYLKIVGARREK